MSMHFHFGVLLLALLLDALIGDPDWLWRKVSHPVVWIGGLIDRLDERYNKSIDSQKRRQQKGVFVLIVLIIIGAVCGWVLQLLINTLVLPFILEAIVVAVFLSSRSLYDHVQQVARKLEYSDLSQARDAVAQIVGRDRDTLDRSAISRAAIESLAENFSDGVIAPALWYLIAGLPGLIVYKMVNTADSMIGHKTARYRIFGWAVARFDDLINLPASRITAILCILAVAILLTKTEAKQALLCIYRDASKHRSPNAGYPESAMAGGLNIALSGPRAYDGKMGNEAWINERGRKQLEPADITSSLSIYVTSVCLFAGIVGVLGIVF